MSVTGRLTGPPVWHPYKSQNGELLNVAFEYSEVIWPWSGYLAVYVMVSEEGQAFEGIAQGHVSLTIESPMEEGRVFSKILACPKSKITKNIDASSEQAVNNL